MNFEDHVTQAFETLTDRLRGEIDAEVRRRTAEIAAAAPAVVHEPAPPVEPSSTDDTSAVRLSDAFQAMDRARSLTEILDTLVSCARAESSDAEVWLIRGDRLHRWSATGSDEAGDDTPPRLEDGIPLTISGATVALLTERRTPNDEPRTTNAERRTSNVVLLARYASRCLESMTAFKTARALTQRSVNADSELRIADGSRSAEADDEEGTSARRYARLLVSEIKLYHEPAVTEGRRDRDLATRLGGEIARARTMYEQRVPPHVRQRADYFHDELVKTLADGDAGLLEVRS